MNINDNNITESNQYPGLRPRDNIRKLNSYKTGKTTEYENTKKPRVPHLPQNTHQIIFEGRK